jgi:hypothetical protein
MKRRRAPLVETRLNEDIYRELLTYAQAQGVRPCVVFREALTTYLARLEESRIRKIEREISTELRESREHLEAILRMGINRFAALLAKTAISAETISEYFALIEKDRAKLDAARSNAAKKIGRSLDAEQRKIKDGISGIVAG